MLRAVSLLAWGLSCSYVGAASPDDIQVDVVAPWPRVAQHSIMEASEFLAGESDTLFWNFLDTVTGTATFTEEEERNLSSETVYPIAFGLAREVLHTVGLENMEASLQLDLSLRSHAVAIEQQRVLAAQTWHSMMPVPDSSSCDVDSAWVAIPHTSSLTVMFCDVEGLLKYFRSEKTPTNGWNAQMDGSIEIFHGDDHARTLPLNNNISSKRAPIPFVVLHGIPSSTSFTRMYNVLMKENNHNVSIHHLVVRYFPTTSRPGSSPNTSLQGYGVTLDIKNMEYITVDVKEGNGAGADENAVAEIEKEPKDVTDGEVVAGIEFRKVLDRFKGQDQSIKELMEFRSKLMAEEEWDEANSAIKQFKVWELQQLGLQSTVNIVNSGEPLKRFVDIVSNFPTRARTVSKTKADQKLGKLVEVAQNALGKQTNVAINGVTVDAGKESFNIFELLNVLRKELRLNNLISNLNLSTSVTEKLFSPNVDQEQGQGSSRNLFMETTRVNVRKGANGAIVFLNNIEKDKTYDSWSPGVRGLTVPNQLASVRKNVFTSIIVLDPGTDEGRSFLLKLLYFMQMGVPVRFGLVMTSPRLVAEARSHMAKKLSVSQVLESDEEFTDDVIPFDGSDECDAECLIQLYMLARKSAKAEGGLNFIAHITQGRQSPDQRTRPEDMGPISKSEACELYGRTMVAAAGAWSAQKHAKEAEEVLSSRKAASFARSSTLKMARYVAERGLPLPSWSLNGEVFPGLRQVDRELQSLLFTEQQRLASEVRRGKLKDSTDVLKFVLAKSSAVDRYSEVVLKADEEKVYLPVPLPIGEPRAKSFGSLLSKARYFEPLGSDKTYTVTLLLFVDFTSITGIERVRDAFLAVSKQAVMFDEKTEDECMKPLARLAVFPAGVHQSHQRRVFGDSTESSSLILWEVFGKVFHAMSQSGSWTEELEAQVDQLFTDSITSMIENPSSTASFATSLLQHRSSSNRKSWEVLDHELKSSQNLEHVLEASATAYHVIKESKAIVTQSMGDNSSVVLEGIVANGRVVFETLLPSDLSTLIRVEHAKHGSLVCNALKTEKQQLDISDTLVSCASLRGVQFSTQRRPALDPKLLDYLNPITYRTAAKLSPTVEVLAIVDPLSHDAQRLAPVLLLLEQAVGARISLILLPNLSLAEFPLSNFFRYVASGDSLGRASQATFTSLPKQQLLTLKVSTPEPWIVYASHTGGSDTDNIQLDQLSNESPLHVEFTLKYLLVTGQCIDVTTRQPPAGMQLELFPVPIVTENRCSDESNTDTCAEITSVADTLVMQNLGYWQMKASPGLWNIDLASGATSEVFEVLATEGVPYSQLPRNEDDATMFARAVSLRVSVKDFSGALKQLRVIKRDDMKHADLLDRLAQVGGKVGTSSLIGKVIDRVGSILPSTLQGALSSITSGAQDNNNNSELDTVHVFSLASGALYERFLRIMMVSVRMSTSGPVKFWLVENFLSPDFKQTIPKLSTAYGFQYELVTYKWPHWLRGQTEKQRIIWGYKILFLDVLFPLDVKKVIYVDADQVVRADLRELWTMDLHGAPYAYTPFCDSREETLGFQFWRTGYWSDHLRGKQYHISALYVVDLLVFRQRMVGDRLRAVYDQLSRDPNSLSNLDQDLPNYAQHMIPIWSLPQEWLWCESWCSDQSKAKAKTIDLCNNPLHKEPKLDMAKRVISGDLFEKSWIELDQEISDVITV